MGGIIGKFFYPFGITVVGGGAGAACSSASRSTRCCRRSGRTRRRRSCKRCRCIGHAIRATDRLMDGAARAVRATDPLDLLRPPLAHRAAGLRPRLRRRRPARPGSARGAGAARRSRRAVSCWPAASPASSLRHGAGAAGRQRVRARDRPGLHAAGAAACRWAAAWSAPTPRCAQIEQVVQAMPEVKHMSTWIGGAGASATRPG